MILNRGKFIDIYWYFFFGCVHSSLKNMFLWTPTSAFYLNCKENITKNFFFEVYIYLGNTQQIKLKHDKLKTKNTARWMKLWKKK